MTPFDYLRLVPYPAKTPTFVIESVISYLGDVIYDPFTGVGSIPIYCDYFGFKGYAGDLTPLGEIVYNTLLEEVDYDIIDKAQALIEKVEPIEPSQFSRRWHPPEFLPFLSKTWAVARQLNNYTLKMALWNATLQFSYADNKIYKVQKSNRSVEKISELVKLPEQNWWNYLRGMVFKINDFKVSLRLTGSFGVSGLADALSIKVSPDVDTLFTSPPLFNAHEYIRSVRLQLSWLYPEETIKELYKKEIPYNHQNEENWLDNYYNDIFKVLDRGYKRIVLVLREIEREGISIEKPIIEHLERQSYIVETILLSNPKRSIKKEQKENFLIVAAIAN
jgi:hypothetical protein